MHIFCCYSWFMWETSITYFTFCPENLGSELKLKIMWRNSVNLTEELNVLFLQLWIHKHWKNPTDIYSEPKLTGWALLYQANFLGHLRMILKSVVLMRIYFLCSSKHSRQTSSHRDFSGAFLSPRPLLRVCL